MLTNRRRASAGGRTAIRLPVTALYYHLSDYGFAHDEGSIASGRTLPADTGNMVGRVVLEGKSRSSGGCAGRPGTGDGRLAEARRRTASLFGVPMLKEDELVGVIVMLCARRCGRSPTSRSSWSQTFADQAVIAIENTRLLNELRSEFAAAADRHRRRAQGHQPLDLRSAGRARYAGRVGGSAVRGGYGGIAPTRRATSTATRAMLRLLAGARRISPKRHPLSQPGRGSVVGRAVLEGQTVHIPDVAG